MKIRKLISVVLTVAMVMSLAAVASGEGVVELPRNETLYFAGLQWGAINGWNPLSSDMNNALAITANNGGSRTPMFETLYMYNLLDGSLTPLLADGDFVWNDDLTEITVKIKEAAMWSDGTPLTAHDVAFSYDAGILVENSNSISNQAFVSGVEAIDDYTVVIKAALTDEGGPVNPLQVLCYLVGTYVVQKDWAEALIAMHEGDPVGARNDPAADVPFSGPYGPFYADDQKVVLVRNDAYWGQDASMWGALPAPKYLAHAIYADNPAGEVAFKAGEVDVCQQFIPNIEDLWLEDGLPISTYLDEAPWGICVNMPTAYFNLEIEALQNVALRKAIAMAVDYDAINQNAMTGQSPTFEAVPRSLMNPTPGEQAAYDHDAVKDLQWAGKDIEGAMAMLDAAGIVDSDGDGWREINGEKISLNACCPNGWTDWQAAMEIVAAAGKNIGVDIVTEYPEWSVYQTIVTQASFDDYDIFMMWTDSATPAMPWGRVRQLLSSEWNEMDSNWSGNWGGYSNERADEIIAAIPVTTDAVALKALYTEAVEIYLTDVPSFSLMYRPNMFHGVNESVWTNYPEATDGRNIPPAICIDGYGIAALYGLELVE